jgi:ubiquinol-cytochrome c reductase cytochrome c subunit
MWIPAGVVYVVTAGALFYSWLSGLQRNDARTRSRRAVLPPLLLVAVFVVAGQLARGGSEARAQIATPPPTVTTLPRVPDVYRADCAYCHGVTGEGTNLGPPLAGVGEASADFMLRTGRMPIDDSEQYPQRGEPAYDEDQIQEMVEYIGALDPGPPIPQVDLAAGDLVEGEQLYIDNCAACHATTGIGGALTDKAVAPSLNASTPVEIAEAVRVGGNGREGSMPVFGPATIDQEGLDSIVRYVVYLQHPEDRGGAGLGHLGPIAEGFVAWLIGLGLLILIILWIGDSAEEAP